MPIDRYDHYGVPRAHVTETGIYLIRDVMQEDGRYAGFSEYAVYDAGDISWRICKESVDFKDIRPFVRSEWVVKD